MDEPLLIGNNLALLVAASELVQRGRQPTLIADGKAFGGHFGGLRIGDHVFDLGLVLIEKLPPTQPGASLLSYDSSIRNDWTRFADRVAHWLDAQLPLRRTPTPTCLVEGRFVADYLIANRLDVFRGASVVAPATLDRSDPQHAVHKNSEGAFNHLSYGVAGRLNHGEEVHARFIEPFVRKLLNVSSDAFEARYHRAGWLPLYYPETLAAARRGEPTGLPEYPFWTTEVGCVAQLIAVLVEKLKKARTFTLVAPTVLSIERSNKTWSVHVEGSGCSTSSQLALGLPADRGRALFALSPLPPPPAASMVLIFCLVRADAIRRATSCLMVVDEAYCTYRLSDQDGQAGLNVPWHRVVMEASPEMLGSRSASETSDAVALSELCSLMDISDESAVKIIKIINARNALALPTSAWIDQANAAHNELVAAAPGAALTGALLGYGATSINDQITQGLKIAEEFS